MKRPWAGGAVALGLIVIVAVVAGLAWQGCRGTLGKTATPAPIRLRTAAVPLNPRDPRQDRVGDFVYAGGLDVTTRDSRRLHGLSDLVIMPDGRLTSEGDEGELFTARLALDGSGRLAGLTNGTLRRLTGLDGKPLASKSWSDAEGAAVWPNGDLMISFERHHRIWRYPVGGGPPVSLPIPVDPAMIGNNGMEGLAVAPAQGPDAYWVGVEWGHIFLCRLAQGCHAVAASTLRPDAFRLSSLTETPDGRLVLLYQSFNIATGAHARVLLVDAPASEHPRVIDVLPLDPPLSVDNFEGVAVVARPDGRQRFFLIVDDNFSLFERTLLLAFDRTPTVQK